MGLCVGTVSQAEEQPGMSMSEEELSQCVQIRVNGDKRCDEGRKVRAGECEQVGSCRSWKDSGFFSDEDENPLEGGF